MLLRNDRGSFGIVFVSNEETKKKSGRESERPSEEEDMKPPLLSEPAGTSQQEVTVSTLKLVGYAEVSAWKPFKIRGKHAPVSRN